MDEVTRAWTHRDRAWLLPGGSPSPRRLRMMAASPSLARKPGDMDFDGVRREVLVGIRRRPAAAVPWRRSGPRAAPGIRAPATRAPSVRLAHRRCASCLPTRSTLIRLSLMMPLDAPLERRIRARQRAASSAASNGLLRKSSAPRSSALTLSERVQRAVRIKRGHGFAGAAQPAHQGQSIGAGQADVDDGHRELFVHQCGLRRFGAGRPGEPHSWRRPARA